ncbi:hypothetical protein O0L34_g2613 [Tuta absoluta]|nr:hypothetical protein O0L34_g2613 [Tuta absoluta]
MTQRGDLITLAELAEQPVEKEEDAEIWERVKLLALESLPAGWPNWQVTRSTKEDVFGEKIDPNVLNKLVFALPAVGVARAFVPDADHLSEKGYRAMRVKLISWAFTRALILGPPAISSCIRGSVVRAEYFKQAVQPLMPMLHTRAEANNILAGYISESKELMRKRRSSDREQDPSTHKRPRLRSPSRS